MDTELREVIREIDNLWNMQQIMMEEDEEFVPSSERAHSMGPDKGEYLYNLALDIDASKILDIGTSHGYAALWLSDVVLKNKGKIITVDNNSNKFEIAQVNITKAGVAPYVEMLQGDGKEVIGNLSGPFDLVFIDGDVSEYVELFKLVLRKVRSGGFIIANCKKNVKGYEDFVKQNPEVKSFTADIGLNVSEKI